MKLLATAALGAALLTPGSGHAQTSDSGASEERERTRSCPTLAKQIARFEDVAERARARDDELWEAATERHLTRLRVRQAARCPDDVPPDLADRLAEALRLVGRAARTAATLGAL